MSAVSHHHLWQCSRHSFGLLQLLNLHIVLSMTRHVQELAAAKLDDVNELWAGLGYYRRARFLLEGAQYVVRDLHGVFPDNSPALQKIPGKANFMYSHIFKTALFHYT